MDRMFRLPPDPSQYVSRLSGLVVQETRKASHRPVILGSIYIVHNPAALFRMIASTVVVEIRRGREVVIGQVG